MHLLEVENLLTRLHLTRGAADVVDCISFALDGGRTLALVGESGCGKTMTAYSIMRLLPSPPASIAGGRILFEGENLLQASTERMRAIRGASIAMIFQEPLTALNPVFTIGSQIAEVFRAHSGMPHRKALDRAAGLLQAVGIPQPEKRLGDYPHQLSGGMRQRVMIAMAIACGPRLLIADEPTTALDVTVQAQIMDLIKDLQRQSRMALLLITHDLGIVAEAADEVAVMYAGRILEYADVHSLYSDPRSPYTRGLLDSLPRPGISRLKPIQGMIPSIFELPSGCKFCSRCDRVFEQCRLAEPGLTNISAAGDRPHWVRCWLYGTSSGAAP